MKTISEIETHEKAPEGFTSQLQAAGCYIEIDGKLLFLQRASGESESGTWGVPAGKLEENETPKEGAVRELFEETGISLDHLSQIEQLSSLYIRKPNFEYVYHLFKVRLDHVPLIRLSDEHESYKWASFQDLEEMPLMAGAKEAVQHYLTKTKKKRISTYVNAYLILKQGSKILLQLRKNTGYCDGMWGLVAGHVEEGEPATEAMIREAREEIGIELSRSQLKVAHMMHRKTNRLNVDLFFDCLSWQGPIKNCEPEKCDKLEFFSLNALPSNIIDYHAIALECVSKGECYSEMGWSL